MGYKPIRVFEDKMFHLNIAVSTVKRRQEMLKVMQDAYYGEHVFRFAFIKLLQERPKEATAFGFYYGFHSNVPLTLRETACKMGVSASMVKYWSNKAYRRLLLRRDKTLIEYGYFSEEEFLVAKARYYRFEVYDAEEARQARYEALTKYYNKKHGRAS